MTLTDGTTEGQEPVIGATEEPVETESQVDEAESAGQGGVDDGEAAWLAAMREAREAGLEPDVVVKNAKQFTQTRQQLAQERAEIAAERERVARAIEVQEAFEQDSGFAEYVLGYQKAEPGLEDTVASIKQRQDEFEAQIRTERLLTDLHAQVTANGKPDFEDSELIEFAIAHNVSDLNVAYTAMKHDEIVKAERDKLFAEEKRKRDEGIQTLPVATAAGDSKVPTLEEMQNTPSARWVNPFKAHKP